MPELMSDARHSQLVKAAEECIDLMNIGSEPNSALRHVKKAFELNDNEVTLVSHAVNNSKQLSHLQSNDSKTKDAPFPLTSADEVSGANSDADLDTQSDESKAKEKQPDALEIAKNVKKASVTEEQGRKSYRKVAADLEQMKADLRSVWGGASASTPVSELRNPYDVTSSLKIAAELARTEAVSMRDKACDTLDKIAASFCGLGSVPFASFEKAASAHGITQELIEIIYDLGPAALEQKRNQEKVAGTLKVDSRVMALLKQAELADKQWQASSDYEAARAHLLDQIATAEKKIALDLSDLETEGRESGGSDTEQATKSLLPFDRELIDKFKSEPEKADRAEISYKTMQQLQNSKARSRLEMLIQDPFVGKHNVPEVVDAYNRAVSVNPDFGDAEINAFVRQDLASKNAVPLDLMVRASNAHRMPSIQV